MAQGLEDVANLDEPVGRVLSAWDCPNGLKIQRVSTPLRYWRYLRKSNVRLMRGRCA